MGAGWERTLTFCKCAGIEPNNKATVVQVSPNKRGDRHRKESDHDLPFIIKSCLQLGNQVKKIARDISL